jgi:uncharacterized damage-inducible protein DinB
MLEHILRAFRFNLDLAAQLVHDINDEQACAQPHGVVNHPSWVLGHLCTSARGLVRILDADADLPDAWEGRFGRGSTPSAVASDYPAQFKLLEILRRVHMQAAQVVEATAAAQFAQPHPEAKLRSRFPTKGDYVVFLMTSHEMGHLGQITAWRRAMGLPSATGV